MSDAGPSAADAFVSYAPQDADWARRLADRLRAAGLDRSEPNSGHPRSGSTRTGSAGSARSSVKTSPATCR
ncbi:toll/interleukin-1 receptor domain-containing protein [Planomonospora sphaerica]|uniref:toll/interleukin-1 receptor domain-containing protein n=1 Tax=Planomonospora sphaerica TaxID=161355 RepID=UPI00129006B3|nr:toll/interleukin-1 receptor domain-containing protein [Planomonospora sphaerica]